MAVIGIGFLILVAVIWRKSARASLLGELGTGVPRDVQNQIVAAMRTGREKSVPDILFKAGLYEFAADRFAKDGDHARAAESYDHAGKASQAIQFYKRAGQHERAARAAEAKGMWSVAAREWHELKKLSKAAAAYAKCNKYQEAAKLYAEVGKFEEAGNAYERYGEHEMAARMYVRHFNDAHRLARGDLGTIDDACLLAKRASELMIKTGFVPEAAGLLRRAGYTDEAAKLFLDAGKPDEAAKTYLEAKMPEKAAPILESVGRSREASVARAEAMLRGGDTESAADHLAKGGEYMRAAELYSEQGRLREAAKSYEAGEDYMMAAEMWLKAGDEVRAAEAFARDGAYQDAAQIMLRGGEKLKAAKLYSMGGDHLQAATLLYKEGDADGAMEVLKHVGDYGENARQARALEGQILYKKGSFEDARYRFEAAIGGDPPDQYTAELYYKAARSCEAAGAVDDAMEYYRGVLGVLPSHEDARQRVKRLNEGGAGRSDALTRGGASMTVDKAKSAYAAHGNPVAANKQATLRYEVIEELARGGMGIVYRARDKVLNRVVAYKILTQELKTTATAVEYFLREARSAAAMSHPNIVTVFDAGEQGDEYYMAMEFVEGNTLKQMVRQQGPFPESLVRFVAIHSCRGLSYAHQKGLVHRDIKSGNIMMTTDRILKIMDFGLAKFVEADAQDHTRAIGTPYYMSPEQILGKELDGRSDIYSLGITLFEVATGRVPFAKGDLAYHHLHTEAPRVRALRSEISPGMEEVIYTCMRKQPQDRYQSADQLLEALRSMSQVPA